MGSDKLKARVKELEELGDVTTDTIETLVARYLMTEDDVKALSEGFANLTGAMLNLAKATDLAVNRLKSLEEAMLDADTRMAANRESIGPNV